jgi:LytR cell envelope-related transcriptional attenuator
MTMLSPLGRVPRQRPVGPRRTRRPVPALILLVALSVLTLVVWWRVMHRGSDEAAAQGCQSVPTLAAIALDPRTVKLRVYNATDHVGLAKKVADALRKRGFSIGATSNDPLGSSRKVQGVGELRYGPGGANQALLTSLYFPGIKLSQDPRTDKVVDVAIGPGYRAVATAAQVTQAKQKAAVQARAGVPIPVGC